MNNYFAKLKLIERRLNKKPLIDPEEAFQQSKRIFQLATGDTEDDKPEKITLYEFVFWANMDISMRDKSEHPESSKFWREIEQGIQENNNFIKDDKDVLAIKMKLF